MDVLLFAEEELVVIPTKPKSAWKLLVVDDEEEVHSITRMVLEGFEFEGAGLEILRPTRPPMPEIFLKPTRILP